MSKLLVLPNGEYGLVEIGVIESFTIKVGDHLLIRYADPFQTKIDGDGNGLITQVTLLVKVVIKPIGLRRDTLRVMQLCEGGGWRKGDSYSIEFESIIRNFGQVKEIR